MYVIVTLYCLLETIKCNDYIMIGKIYRMNLVHKKMVTLISHYDRSSDQDSSKKKQKTEPRNARLIMTTHDQKC